MKSESAIEHGIKIVYFFILFFILPTARLSATNIDSLKIAVLAPNIHDTAKVYLLIDLATAFQDVSLDSSVVRLRQAMLLSDSIHFATGSAKSRHQLGLSFLFKNENDSSLKYYQAAINIYQQNGIVRPQGNAYLSIADIYLKQGRFQPAIDYYNKGNSICEQVKNYVGKGFGLMSIGGVYSTMGNHSQAIDYYLQSLASFEKEHYNAGYCIGLTTIATEYATLKNQNKAIEYIKKSDGVNLENATTEQKLYIVFNKATVYSGLNKLEEGLAGFKKALQLATQMGDDSWRCSCIANMGDMYFGLNKYDSAQQMYNEALDINKKINDPSVQIIGETGIGRILLKRGNINEGLHKIQKAFDVAVSNKLKQSIYETAKELSAAFDSCKRYDLALKYHKVYTIYKDSVHNDKNNIRIQQLQFDYDISRKEAKIELLNKKKLIAQSENEKQAIVLKILTLIGFAFVLIAAALFITRRAEQKSKNKIKAQTDQLQKQAEKLKELNEFKDRTFSVLSHDLRGPISSFAMVLQAMEHDTLSPEQFDQLKATLHTQTQSLNVLLEDLLNWAKLYMKGKVSKNATMVDLKTLVERSFDIFIDIAQEKKVVLINDVQDNVFVWADKEQLSIVIRNLVSNAVKFSNIGGMVKVFAKSDGVNALLFVVDQGIGMDKAQVDQLFDWSNHFSSLGTLGEKGIGLGMKLCVEFVRSNNGIIEVRSEKNKGTTIEIVLPINEMPERI